ncbi:MAG: siderophore-interacting protein [Pseudomonadota bacterium]
MTDERFPLEAQADLPGVPYASIRQAILSTAQSSGLEVLEDREPNLTVKTAHGLIGLRPGHAASTAGMVAATDARRLFVMKDAVVSQMKRMMPEVAHAMRWSDGDVEGSLPPNFQFVRVIDVQAVGSVFVRVTLSGESLSSYGTDSIHFRLLQPAKGIEPEWPALAANGTTTWPQGPGAVHKPVYTARAVDHSAGHLVTDVFLHQGGRTTAWAQELLAGERHREVVGVVGPSGGGLLHADRVLMASDETGFPAVARLLENLPEHAVGALYLEAVEGEACAYPLVAPAGISVHWLSRRRGERLIDAAGEALSRHRDASVWFAGERDDARALRETAKADGWDPKALRISGFWRRASSGLL